MDIFKKAMRRVIKLYHKLKYKNLNDEKIITTGLTKDEINSILNEWISELKKSAWETDYGVLGEYYKHTGKLLVKYRYRKMEYRNETNTYDKYYILASVIRSEDNNTYCIRYSFVNDRLIRINSFSFLICYFLIIGFFKFHFDSYFIVELILFASLGLLIVFGKNEKKEEAVKAVEIFEKKMKSRFHG
jgi:surface polysaccharide O-acyltransferase-like enzyme